MKKVCLTSVILLACSHSCCAIYGPSLTRADPSVALRACQEANFAQGNEITKAMQGCRVDILLKSFAFLARRYENGWPLLRRQPFALPEPFVSTSLRRVSFSRD
jgi:hypothetical protein